MKYLTRNIYRSFREEFVDHMVANDGWPEGAIRTRLLVEKKHPARRQDYSRLQNGEMGPAHYARALIEILLENSKGRITRHTNILLEYLHTRGFETVTVSDVDVVLSQVCSPPMRESRDGMVSPYKHDSLRHYGSVLKTWPVTALYTRMIAGIGGRHSLALAAHWIYVRAAQELAPRSQSMTEAECVEWTNKRLGLSEDECAAYLHALSNKEPWSVLFARKGRSSFGVSVAVPLQQRIYEEVRSGKMGLFDIEPKHIESPSNHLAFIALAENPDAYREGKDPTRLLLGAVAAQYAALFRCGRPGRLPTYKVIAPEGTRSNRDRMIASQFRALSSHDPRHKVRLWEREFDFETGEGLLPIEVVILRKLGASAGSAPPVV